MLRFVCATWTAPTSKRGLASVIKIRCSTTACKSPASTKTTTSVIRPYWRQRHKSTAAAAEYASPSPRTRPAPSAVVSSPAPTDDEEVRRLLHLRNVGILAHVDAGKTTVTERMLALAGVIRRAGSVDSGNTVTDYLPAERERGITIQSAAIGFAWGWHNNRTGDDYDANDAVQIRLIDTPGHVDFSVEVNRSVAVLDGAVLVVDAVAGAQAQTETVWRAITRPSMNNHQQKEEENRGGGEQTSASRGLLTRDHGHEPLPCLAFVNKMDKEGCHYGNAIHSLRRKLPGANPIPIQIPLFRTHDSIQISAGDRLRTIRHYLEMEENEDGLARLRDGIVAVPLDDLSSSSSSTIQGNFVGVVDLVHMRAVVWPDPSSSGGVSNVDECIPDVINLLHYDTHEPIDPNCPITRTAFAARADLIASLADVDESIEEYYLLEEEPTNAELRAALRRATLARKALPVMAGAALRGKGVEPLLDAVADLLPSPLDRMPPALTEFDVDPWSKKRNAKNCVRRIQRDQQQEQEEKTEAEAEEDLMAAVPLSRKITFGHPLHPALLALAFKVVHMKGRGGSGDGRVVFARVYSGQIRARDTVRVISPPSPGEMPEEPQTERVGGMLELAGGRFDNMEDGLCRSGDVCALVGLKRVVTGDTLLLASDHAASSAKGGKKKGKKKGNGGMEGIGNVCLAGVASPKPVLTVQVEAESSEQQARLSDALALLAIEDPSIIVTETESATLLSGLGELHIEVTLDRLRREYGLEVRTGSPAVAYRETVVEAIQTLGGTLFDYDRTIGGTRMQASVHIVLEPLSSPNGVDASSSCAILSDPIVIVGPKAREYLGVDDSLPEEDLIHRCDVVRALVAGCKGSLRRGALGSYPMANVRCHVIDVDAEGGLSSLTAMPGSIRAAAAHAIAVMLAENRFSCALLEPTMSVEVTVPGYLVGSVLSDLASRRGSVGDVVMGDEESGQQMVQAKALVRGEVPLVEILGYANSLRSLTGGEGAFTAEYKGHSPCDEASRIGH